MRTEERPDESGVPSGSGRHECLRHYAVGCAAFLSPREALYFFSNRSMRPAVSINFWRPVKNGWQDEQISTRISPLCVELVLKVWPQAQMTLTSL
jgi:hypothetical protein